MGPEPSVIVSTFLLAGMTHRLAGKSSTNQIDRFQFLAGQRGHILVAWDVGPVLRQHPLAPRIALHLPPHGHPRPFQSQIQTADAGEQ